jgi:hypothetical protein
MIPYILGAAVITHVAPDVWSWGFWGASVLCRGTYWLVYGRFEELRREQRLRTVVREEIQNEFENFELTVGGTDVILVRKQ